MAANHWPYRPETLVRRFEAAAMARWDAIARPAGDMARIEAAYRLARRDLLIRIAPATRFQRKTA